MTDSRLKTLNLAIKIVFVVIVIRLAYWQIIKSKDLKKQALNQSFKIEKIYPQRGKILASDGYPLAFNQTSQRLSIYKPNLEKPLNQVLDQIIDIKPEFATDNDTLIGLFQTNPNQLWQSFSGSFTDREVEILSQPGLQFDSQPTRFYAEDIFSPLIGTISQKSGLEHFYHKTLQGKTGFLKTAQDATGNPILSQKTWHSPAVPGQNLSTSLDRRLQFIAHQQLQQALSLYQAESGTVIITTPEHNRVLAMVSLEASSSATASASLNPAIANLFEPGSIFKPIVVAIGLETKSVDKNFVCSCERPRQIGEYTINNWNLEVHPNSDLQTILKNSDNIGMSYIIDQIGIAKFTDYFHRLKLDQRSGIDLPAEAKPLPKNYWPAIDLATASFGQGFAITPIQMITAFNSLATGQISSPRLAESNTAKSLPVFSATTVDHIKQLLKYTVENSNTNNLRPSFLDVCGKTGTAQIAQFGQYTESATYASFIGFSPCQQPKFSMLVVLKKPKTSPWGATTAAPLWFQIASKINFLL